MKLSSRKIIKAADLEAVAETVSSYRPPVPHQAEGQAFGLVSQRRDSQRQSESDESRQLLRQAQQEAESVIRQAEQQAAQIIAESEAEAEQKVQQQTEAGYEEGYQQGRQEGYQTGYSEGLAQAQEEVANAWKDKLQQFAEVVTQAAAARDSALELGGEDVLKLSLAVAEKIIRSRIAHDPMVTVNVAEAALRRVNGSSRVKVRVHPSLLLVMEEHKAQLMAVKGIDEIEFVEDAQVEPGGCLIETDFGRVDGRLSSRLEEIAQAIMEVMYSGD